MMQLKRERRVCPASDTITTEPFSLLKWIQITSLWQLIHQKGALLSGDLRSLHENRQAHAWPPGEERCGHLWNMLRVLRKPPWSPELSAGPLIRFILPFSSTKSIANNIQSHFLRYISVRWSCPPNLFLHSTTLWAEGFKSEGILRVVTL